jgi:hypothetical protein
MLVTNWEQRHAIDLGPAGSMSVIQDAYDLRKIWLDAGYKSLWQLSDGRVKPSMNPMLRGDLVRYEGGPSDNQRLARRVDLHNKAAAGAAIADAMRAGYKFAVIEDRRRERRAEVERRRIAAAIARGEKPWKCPKCGDETSFCDCSEPAGKGARHA